MTPNLNLPYIIASQAQKEVTHAEGLNRLDALVQTSVLSQSLAVPPGSPVEGDCYVVAAGAAGDWLGQDGALAQFIGGVWQFYVPLEGWRVWVADEQLFTVYTGGAWRRTMQLNSYALAALPVAGDDGQLIFVSDETGGAVPAFSFNNQWLRITDRAIVA